MCSYAKKDLELAHNARDESAAMVEKLTRRNEELESRLRQAEDQLQSASTLACKSLSAGMWNSQ